MALPKSEIKRLQKLLGNKPPLMKVLKPRKYDFDKLYNRLVEAEHERDERLALLQSENPPEEGE